MHRMQLGITMNVVPRYKENTYQELNIKLKNLHSIEIIMPNFKCNASKYEIGYYLCMYVRIIVFLLNLQ